MEINRDLVKAARRAMSEERTQRAEQIASLEAEVADLRALTAPRDSDEAVDPRTQTDRGRRILACAEDVFGSREKAERWIRKPYRSLGGQVPLDLLVTDEGADQVEAVLVRIDYGVYS